jgi:hypothetical protein
LISIYGHSNCHDFCNAQRDQPNPSICYIINQEINSGLCKYYIWSNQNGGTMKKLVVSATIAPLLIIALAGATLTVLAQAGEKELPMKGTLQSVETYVVTPPFMSVTANGSGNATHLGKFTINYEVQVNLETIAGVGSAQLVAANGDVLYANLLGQATPAGQPDVFNVVEEFTITGGTGRFANASGSFTLNREVNITTGATSGSFDGSIVVP